MKNTRGVNGTMVSFESGDRELEQAGRPRGREDQEAAFESGGGEKARDGYSRHRGRLCNNSQDLKTRFKSKQIESRSACFCMARS